MKNDKEYINKIIEAQNGNMKALFEIILKFEPLINKESIINGRLDEDCKDYIVDQLIKKIKNFKFF